MIKYFRENPKMLGLALIIVLVIGLSSSIFFKGKIHNPVEEACEAIILEATGVDLHNMLPPDKVDPADKEDQPDKETQVDKQEEPDSK